MQRRPFLPLRSLGAERAGVRWGHMANAPVIGRFVLRRLGIAVLQLLGVALAVFFLIRLLPADPVARLVGLNASEEAYAPGRAHPRPRPARHRSAAELPRPLLRQRRRGTGRRQPRTLVGDQRSGVSRNWTIPAGHAGAGHARAADLVPDRHSARHGKRDQAGRHRRPHRLCLGPLRRRPAGLLVGSAVRLSLLLHPRHRAAAARPDRPAPHATERDNGFPHHRFAAAGALRHVRLGPPPPDAADPDPGVSWSRAR